MADLAKELEELHASVVRTVRSRIESGEDIDNDDLRVAMQLLKQNAITANLTEVNTEQMKSKMAAKLNFSSLKEKVIPLRQPPNVSPRHNSDENQSA
jgi:hypothetical protein